jgi:succinate dehydrogenase / fumarate reductase iron-sulfur subunit/fumarate reductase iron-sulfur subunit
MVAPEPALAARVGASAGPPPGTIEVTVARSDPAARRDFRVERFRPMVVLDLLIAIQQEHDPSLAFRYSCRVAACGTCTVRVDGRPVLACQTIVEDDRRAARFEPLGGLPVVRDLIVDLDPFLDRWRRVTPFLVPIAADGEPERVVLTAPDRGAIDEDLDCIACGACFAACGMAAADASFLGPAALLRAMLLVADRRDGAADARLGVVGGDGGVDFCHGIGACTEVCPKGLDPARAIRRLRRWRLRPPR